jgi:hypothetical protein
MMNQFTGTVSSIGEGDYKRQFGWIEYTPKEDDPEEVDDRIYFQASDVSGEMPKPGFKVKFERAPHPDAADDPDKKHRYVAKKVTIVNQ